MHHLSNFQHRGIYSVLGITNFYYVFTYMALSVSIGKSTTLGHDFHNVSYENILENVKAYNYIFRNTVQIVCNIVKSIKYRNARMVYIDNSMLFKMVHLSRQMSPFCISTTASLLIYHTSQRTYASKPFCRLQLIRTFFRTSNLSLFKCWLICNFVDLIYNHLALTCLALFWHHVWMFWWGSLIKIRN